MVTSSKKCTKSLSLNFLLYVDLGSMRRFTFFSLILSQVNYLLQCGPSMMSQRKPRRKEATTNQGPQAGCGRPPGTSFVTSLMVYTVPKFVCWCREFEIAPRCNLCTCLPTGIHKRLKQFLREHSHLFQYVFKCM